MLAVVLFGISYITRNQLMFGICDNQYNFGDYQGCLDKSSQTVGKPLYWLSIALIIVSFFLFFVRDGLFIKWFRFALGWFFVSVVLISLVPVSVGGWLGIGPTKLSVSIAMSELFVVISLAMFAWEWWKTRKKS